MSPAPRARATCRLARALLLACACAASVPRAARAAAAAGIADRPHIVIIVADDLGWNDVGFHGMNHIPTPNVDALAAAGVVLNRHYVLPLCTPSRAALLTGKYPIHTGMQHGVLYGADDRGLPLEERLLPELLRARGYRTHLVGKWHLGSARRGYLPLNRGFESHVGFWTGKIDMFDHTNQEQGHWGFDFRRDFMTAHDLFGKYATDIYTDEAVKVIEAHNASEPLFLMVSHSAVHSGNPADPIRAPPRLVDEFRHINDSQRQRFAGVLSRLDSSVGAVTAALGARGLLACSVLLFTTDNGGVPAGFNDNAGSNYPLRGTKNTLWEGGVRGAAVLLSPLLERRGRVDTQPVHLVDWLPTLAGLAGGAGSLPPGLDGLDVWPALSSGQPLPARGLLLNIDPVTNCQAILRHPWKLLQGTTYNGSWDGWYGPAGREGAHSPRAARRSPAGRALSALGLLPDDQRMEELRRESTVTCEGGEGGPPGAACRPLQAACLFHVEDDPCERRNLADSEPGVVSSLQAELAALAAGARPAAPPRPDPRGDPAHWGHVYTNYLDYLHEPAPARDCL